MKISIKKIFEQNTTQKITALAFLVVIFSMFFVFIFNYSAFKTDFLEDYRMEVPTGAPFSERISGAIDAWENQVDDKMMLRNQFNELYGLAQLTMNKKVMRDPNYGNLFKTAYGQITYAVPKRQIDSYILKTTELARSIEAAGIPFLYVQAPFKLPPGKSQIPASATDYSNINADKFLRSIEAFDVNTFDLRPGFWGSGLPQNQLFFNTDHHWTIQGAFLATGLLEEELNKNYGFNIPEKYRNIKNFTSTTHPRFYIGSMGRRVGEIYGGIDDFTLITPDFDTDFTLHQWDYGVEKVFNGSFEDAVLVNSYMDSVASIDTNRYAVYHGDNTELIFENHLVDDGKILIIKDSFGVPVYSFLSLGLHEIRAIDVRLFTEDVAEYAKKYNPDLVILLYNADSLNKDMFKFKEKTITPEVK